MLHTETEQRDRERIGISDFLSMKPEAQVRNEDDDEVTELLCGTGFQLYRSDLLSDLLSGLMSGPILCC